MSLHFINACRDKHFEAMSLIHALGWRDTYADAVPADWMAEHVTDDRWVTLFRADHEQKRCNGLLLYNDDTPVGCINYGPARIENLNAGSICHFQSAGYEGWGELISFYVHPEHRSRGYGHLLIEEACRRLKADGFENAYVLVLRENIGARRFYAAHGFAPDGSYEDIPFPPDTICVDLRYTRTL